MSTFVICSHTFAIGARTLAEETIERNTRDRLVLALTRTVSHDFASARPERVPAEFRPNTHRERLGPGGTRPCKRNDLAFGSGKEEALERLQSAFSDGEGTILTEHDDHGDHSDDYSGDLNK